jgi:hypothetical protein
MALFIVPMRQYYQYPDLELNFGLAGSRGTLSVREQHAGV